MRGGCYVGKATKIFLALLAALAVVGVVLAFHAVLHRAAPKSSSASASSACAAAAACQPVLPDTDPAVQQPAAHARAKSHLSFPGRRHVAAAAALAADACARDPSAVPAAGARAPTSPAAAAAAGTNRATPAGIPVTAAAGGGDRVAPARTRVVTAGPSVAASNTTCVAVA